MIEFTNLPKDDPRETLESKVLTAKGHLQWRLMVLVAASAVTAICWYRGVEGSRNITSGFMALMITLLFG